MIKVLSIAGFGTIQDFGRKSTRKWGIPPGGHMDHQSARHANQMLGNDFECALIELFGGHMTFEVSVNQWFSFTGGRSLIKVGSEEYHSPCRVLVSSDAKVSIGAIENGNIVYIGVKNGLEADESFGSRSTYIPSSLGPNHGRPLKPRDKLIVLPHSSSNMTVEEVQQLTYYPNNLTVCVAAGPEYELLGKTGKLNFFRESFKIERVNRIGYKLSGPEVDIRSQALTSRFVSRGTVQLPIGGQPIILMSDAQTTGGYPRVAQLLDQDIDRVSQLKPGSRIRFQLV